jgi:hypothetical protein
MPTLSWLILLAFLCFAEVRKKEVSETEVSEIEKQFKLQTSDFRHLISYLRYLTSDL